MESAPKRRRIQRSVSPTYNLDIQEDDYQPYVPVAQRREQKLAKLSSWGAHAEKSRAKKQEEQEEREDAEREEEERKREKARKERTLLMEAQEVHSQKALEGWLFICCFAQVGSPVIKMLKNRKRNALKRSMQRSWQLLQVDGSSHLT